MDRTDTLDFIKCAEECRMGDADAMLKMHMYLRERLSERCIELERQSVLSGNFAILKDHIINNRDDFVFLLGANMWAVRAALHGSTEAKDLVERNPHYEEFSLINSCGHLWQNRSLTDPELKGSEFKQIGIADLPADKKYSFYSQNGYGYYTAEAYVGYDGPDETGFGMENEYDFIYLDDFFNVCCVITSWSYLDIGNNAKMIYEEADKARAAAAAQREAYWSNKKSPAD